ncbi:MAG TPA: GPW/gp25 family protein [Vicinamibacterales bacterium]|nr:GPW/gp25 family protein [Vicinamibacterales bacterium]
MTAFRDPVSWPFLPVPVEGVLTFPTLEKSVRDSIRIILTTRRGEQLLRPEFGAGLQNFLEESNTVATRSRIQAAILSSLQTYEARAVFDRVDVDPVDGAPGQLHVQIFYRLLRTGAAQQTGLMMRVS